MGATASAPGARAGNEKRLTLTSTAVVTVTEHMTGPPPPPAPPPPSPTEAVVSLPAQTTPFTPPGGGVCDLHVYCPGLEHHAWTAGRQSLSGQHCEAVHLTVVGTTPAAAAGGGKTKTKNASSPLPTPTLLYNPECYPAGYLDVFPALRLGPDGVAAGPSNAQLPPAPSDPALAYPGTACISGWTTACTATMGAAQGGGDGEEAGAGATATAAHRAQAWCCPPGSWTCEAPGLVPDPVATVDTARRRCVSALAGPRTSVWMRWDPAYRQTDDGGVVVVASRLPQEVTASVAGPGDGASVYHFAFPLALTDAEMPHFSSGSDPSSHSHSDSDSDLADALTTKAATATATKTATVAVKISTSSLTPSASASTSTSPSPVPSTPTEQLPPPPPPPPPPAGLSRGTMAGAAVGAAGATAALGALALWLFLRYRRARLAATEIVERRSVVVYRPSSAVPSYYRRASARGTSTASPGAADGGGGGGLEALQAARRGMWG